MTVTFRYKEGADKPDIELWWTDSTGALINFAVGKTWQVILAEDELTTAVLNTTAGVTGAAGTGTPAEGTPNVTISVDAIGLDSLEVPAGLREIRYRMWLRETTTNRDYPERIYIILEAWPPVV